MGTWGQDFRGIGRDDVFQEVKWGYIIRGRYVGSIEEGLGLRYGAGGTLDSIF